MDPFLKKFFPEVFRKKQEAKTNQYCKYDNQLLQTFTSSLYLAALVASFFAATVTRVMGRKWSMFGGGLTFLIGAALNGAAKNVAMLIVGRILLGIGVGFANQVLAYYSITHRHRSIDRLSITTDMHTYNYIRFQRKKRQLLPFFYWIGG